MSEEQKKVTNWNDDEDYDEEDEDFEFGQAKEKAQPVQEPAQHQDDEPLERAHQEVPEETKHENANNADSNQGRDEYVQRNNYRNREDKPDRGYNKRRGDKFGDDQEGRPQRRENRRGGRNNDKWGDQQEEQQDGEEKPYFNRNNRKDYNRRDNQRGPKGGADHFDQSEIDPNSNYRQYYCNDPDFFMKVLGLESAPFNFKLHAFPKNKHHSYNEEEKPDMHQMRIDQEMAIGKILEKHNAKDIRFQKIPDGDKTRYNFTIEEQTDAISCFEEVSKKSAHVLEGRVQLRIFYVKPESVFMKYADTEAAAYNEMMEHQRKEKDEKRQQQPKRGNRDDAHGGPQRNHQNQGKYNNKRGRMNEDGQQNENLSQVQASTGIKFASGPQQFTRTKPKTHDEEHKIVQQPEKDVLLSAKPTDGSHRTITDNTKKEEPSADNNNSAPAKSDKPQQHREPREPREPREKDGQQREGGRGRGRERRGGRGGHEQREQDPNAVAGTEEEVKEVAEGNQGGHQGQKGDRRGGRGGRGRGERGGRRYNDDGGEHQNKQRGGDDPSKQTQQIVYRKVKKTEHENAGGHKEQSSKQQPQSTASSKQVGGAPDLKKNKSTASNTTNRFSAMDDSDDE